MDNVTHTLVGVALARAGLQRITPRATLLLVLSSNIPDIDIVALAGGPLAYLEAHRGYTHSFLALPFLALICVLLTALIGRKRLPWAIAWGVACVGVAGHLLLDWTNSYGIRPLIPFSSRWFYLDLNGLYDFVLLAALGLALVWPWFSRLVAAELGAKETGRGQGSAIAVLLFFLLFDGLRWSLHKSAVTELNSRMYDGEVAASVAALPHPDNPFQWTGIVETQNAFRLLPVNVLSTNLGLDHGSEARMFFKPPVSAAYKAAMATEPFRYMAYFSRFPVWGIEPVHLQTGNGQRLDLTDLRFGTPYQGGFHAIADVTASGQVVMSQFTFGSGGNLGWAEEGRAPTGAE